MKRLNKPSSEEAIKPVTWLGVPDNAMDKLGAFIFKDFESGKRKTVY